MKPAIALAVIAFLTVMPIAAQGAAPREVAGFALGTLISEVAERVELETALPIRYMECLKEVEVKDIPGIKTGLIAYGTCAHPGRILRIKLKYADSTKAFYEKLLARFKERFGAPTEWRGDPFHVVKNWKWSFVDAENNRISLHLSHNELDREEKFGNAVKMTLTSGIEEELECFKRRHPDFREPRPERAEAAGGSPDWERLIPR